MKITIFISTLLTVFMLQACAGQAKMAEWDYYDDRKRSSKQPTSSIKSHKQANLSNVQAKTADNIRLTTPETQIIRELYDAGCMIEDFTLDRRKQNIQISCAKGLVQEDSSSI